MGIKERREKKGLGLGGGVARRPGPDWPISIFNHFYLRHLPRRAVLEKSKKSPCKKKLNRRIRWRIARVRAKGAHRPLSFAPLPSLSRNTFFKKMHKMLKINCRAWSDIMSAKKYISRYYLNNVYKTLWIRRSFIEGPKSCAFLH